MRQARHTGRGRSHGRKGPSGEQYTFRSDDWTDIPDERDVEQFERLASTLEFRDKPATESVAEAAEPVVEAASGFLTAVRKAGGSAIEMLDGMGYDEKHEAADELGLDVAGNASHSDLDDAIQSEVDDQLAEETDE